VPTATVPRSSPPRPRGLAALEKQKHDALSMYQLLGKRSPTRGKGAHAPGATATVVPM
jgi:hypothetical protein